MQRFTLIHDGSDQGWQAAYLAFHVAARLGAPLLVLLDRSAADEKLLAERAGQVKVGGRAAGVAIETRPVTDFSVDVLSEHATAMDGIFVPDHLVADAETALHYLESLSCPLWIVTDEAAASEMTVLVNDLDADATLLRFAAALAHRLRQSVRGIIKESDFGAAVAEDGTVSWIPLTDLSLSSITSILNQTESSLLVLPASAVSLVPNLVSNCVVYPARQLA